MHHLGLDAIPPAASRTTTPSARTLAISPSCSTMHLAGVLEHRRDVARDDVLALADADDQRRLLARRDDLVGIVDVHDRQRVAALKVLDRAGDSGHQVTVVVALDEVRDGLGVGLAAQRCGRLRPAPRAARRSSR